MRQLKVLVYGDIDLNFIDGSAIWLTSIAKMLNEASNIETDILLKAKIKHRLLIDEIAKLTGTKLIEGITQSSDIVFKNNNRMNVDEAVHVMKKLDEKNNYNVIIVRGLDLVNQLMSEKDLAQKTIPYITNFEHNLCKINKQERSLLKKIYCSFPKLFMQTPEMKQAFLNIVEVKENKIEILSPMIPNIIDRPKFKNSNNRIVYTGKFSNEWYIEEMLEIFGIISDGEDNYQLAVAGNKFQDELAKKKDLIIEKFTKTENIEWHGGISREECQKLIKDSDLGFSYRSEKIDNDESVELSTKLLEYASLGKPILCRPTKMHKNLLGDNYPLFINSHNECVKKITEVFNDVELYQEAGYRCFEAVKKFTFQASYQRLKGVLWSFCKQPIKLLIAGHDLKFLTIALKEWEKNELFDIKIDTWNGHNKHDEVKSIELLQWADIIFCEWGLGNAVWYSKHKKEHQKLIIRLHAQEANTVYPAQYNLEKIDQFIAISPLVYEKFHQQCYLPKQKMTMIYNMIDSKRYTLDKGKNYEFNIGIVGILPQIKRLDRAIDIVEKLIVKDKRYKLFIKGKMPTDLPWMKNRPEELSYYEKQFLRIKEPHLKKHIFIDEYGSDMDKWFKKIGIVLSTSDNESFHLAPIEGMATGAMPCIIHWEGAETVYPKEFINETLDDMVNMILKKTNKYSRNELAEYPKKHFGKEHIIHQINQLITNLIEE